MKINIFFFSKWKWKADALIQTLYKRAGLGQKKRNSFSRCARARPFPSHPLLFSFATSRPYPRLATSKIPHPLYTASGSSEKKQKRQWGGRPGCERKVHSGIILYFGPSTPGAQPSSVHPPCRSASQPFIGRLGNLQTLKRTKGNDGFPTPAWTRVVMVEVVVRVGKGHRRRPGDEKK